MNLLRNTSQHANDAQNGGALLYILIAIALLGALTVSLSGTSGQINNTQSAERLKVTLQSQIAYLRNAIEECVTEYPAGDPTINVASTTDAGYVAPYPLTANSSHYAGSTLGAAPEHLLKYIRCPGNPGVDNNHAPIFGDVSGKTMPQLPLTGSEWFYTNKDFAFAGETAKGVQFRFSTSQKAPYIALAFQELADEYRDCQADYIIGDGTNGCASGNQCFRIWLVRKEGC